MKKSVKTIASALLIIAILSSFLTVSSAFSFSKIIWKGGLDYPCGVDNNGIDSYCGELKEGKNNITVGGKNAYSFKAPEKGYYDIAGDFFGYCVSRKAIGNTVTEYAVVGGYHGPHSFDIIYLEKGEKVFLDFYNHADYDEETDEETEVITRSEAEVTYLGEIKSYSLKNNNVCIFQNPEGLSDIEPQSPVILSFSSGKQCTAYYILCEITDIDNGTHEVFCDVFEGHGFNLTINIINIAGLIEKVELPEGFTPKALVYYDEWIVFGNEDLPDYIMLYFKDGTKKKVLRIKDTAVYKFSYRGRDYTFTGCFDISPEGNLKWNVSVADFGPSDCIVGSFDAQATPVSSPFDIFDFAKRLFSVLRSYIRNTEYNIKNMSLFENISIVTYNLRQAIENYTAFEMLVLRSKLGK